MIHSSYIAQISGYMAENNLRTAFKAEEKEMDLILNLEEQVNMPQTLKEVVPE